MKSLFIFLDDSNHSQQFNQNNQRRSFDERPGQVLTSHVLFMLQTADVAVSGGRKKRQEKVNDHIVQNLRPLFP